MNEREIKLECLKLAAQLMLPNKDPSEIIKVSDVLYTSLPPGPDASKTRQAMARSVERESRKADAAGQKN